MKNVIFTIILTISPFICKSQNDDKTVKQLQEKIENLERKNTYLEEDYNRLKQKHETLEKDYDGNKEFIENWKIILSLCGLTTLLGIGGYLYLIFKYIPNKVKSECNDSITKELRNRREDYMNLLSNYDLEQIAKKKYTIKLLNHKNSNDAQIYNLLLKNGFTVISDTNLVNLLDAKIIPDEVIFINNENGGWDVNEIQAYLQNMPNYLFYFGKGVIQLDGIQQTRFAAANIKTQFIGNLLNLLKYN